MSPGCPGSTTAGILPTSRLHPSLPLPPFFLFWVSVSFLDYLEKPCLLPCPLNAGWPRGIGFQTPRGHLCGPLSHSDLFFPPLCRRVSPLWAPLAGPRKVTKSHSVQRQRISPPRLYCGSSHSSRPLTRVRAGFPVRRPCSQERGDCSENSLQSCGVCFPQSEG